MKKGHSKLSKNEPVCMCKRGWCVGLGQEEGCLRESGGNCLKYLKKGWDRKEGRRNKNFKNGSKLGQEVDVLKRGRLQPTYELC